MKHIIARDAYNRIDALLAVERAKCLGLERRVTLLADLLELATARGERYREQLQAQHADTVLDADSVT